MKKIISIIMIIFLVLTIISCGCGSKPSPTPDPSPTPVEPIDPVDPVKTDEESDLEYALNLNEVIQDQEFISITQFMDYFAVNFGDINRPLQTNYQYLYDLKNNHVLYVDSEMTVYNYTDYELDLNYLYELNYSIYPISNFEGNYQDLFN